MANFDSDLINRNLRHRGTTSGKEYTVSGRRRVAAGGSIATTDLLRMVPLGESQRPIRLVAWIKAVTGTPVLTNASFSFGIAPVSASNLTRPDGSVYASDCVCYSSWCFYCAFYGRDGTAHRD